MSPSKILQKTELSKLCEIMPISILVLYVPNKFAPKSLLGALLKNCIDHTKQTNVM